MRGGGGDLRGEDEVHGRVPLGVALPTDLELGVRTELSVPEHDLELSSAVHGRTLRRIPG